ncbi:MAG: right-handed parallel beta-helix repeat-containing protein [Proteobacteria bacterium]|nr:right-handed parallel beta-helix repeat-containing protein [Pseudomonadota bacterium]
MCRATVVIGLLLASCARSGYERGSRVGDASARDGAPGDGGRREASTRGDGRLGDAATLPVLRGLAVRPRYALHPAWNQYIVNSDPRLRSWEHPDVVCDPALEAPYSACVHAGAVRELRLPGIASCAGLSAADSRDAFVWSCAELGGEAVFFSTALRPTVGLFELLDGSNDFRPLSVTVRAGARLVAESASEVWWTNQVRPLPSNGGLRDAAAVLDLAGAIYVATEASDSRGYEVRAERVAIVTAPGATLRAVGFPDSSGLVSVSGHDFFWIEGDFDGGTRSATLSLTQSRRAVLRNLRVQRGNRGISLQNCTGARLSQLRVSNTAGTGLAINGSAVTATDLAIGNGSPDSSDSAGLTIAGQRHTFVRVVLSHLAQGLEVSGGTQHTLSHLTIANTAGVGLALTDTSEATVAQVLALNHQGSGIELSDTASARLSELALLGNRIGIRVVARTGLVFSGRLLLGGNTDGDCRVNFGDGSGIDEGCVAQSGSTLEVLRGLEVSATFRGRVTSDDTACTTDVAGAQAATPTADWVRTESPLRLWGPEGELFPAPGLARACAAAGPCRLWDLRLRPGDTVLTRRSGAGLTQNSPFASGASCPAAVHGDQALLDGQGRTFLRNATELLGDGVGNDNGLCESGEACSYSPHHGAWQGDGALREPCLFQSGLVSEVVMRAYQDGGG